MKKTQRTGKAFRIKWLVLALAAMALILMPAASQKVSASKLVYTVKFNNNSGTSKSKTYISLTRNVTLNTTIKLPSVPKAVGYQNLGWTTQKGSTKVVYKAGASVKVKKDMTLYAVRRKSKYYTVSFYLGNGSTNAVYKKLTKSVEEGTYYTLPSVPSRTGYVNLGWSTTKNGKSSTAKKAGTKIKIAGNIKYYAVQMQSVSVNLCKANGTVWKTVTLGKGGYLKLPSASNASGYTFMGWYWDPDYHWQYTYDQAIEEDCTLYARWEVTHFSIIYDVGKGYASRSNPRTYTYFDKTIKLKPAKKEGYRFVGWFDEIGNELIEIREHSLGNKKLIAHFEKMD